MSPKGFQERLLYHARRFQCKPPQNVLKRYQQRHHSLQFGELQKNTFHIASWVAELPASQLILEHDGLSVVSLLRRYLKSLKHGESLCDHLTKVLSRISERIQASSDIAMACADLVEDLQHFVPEAKATKAARLMNQAIHLWRNTTSETKQEEYVAGLEKSIGEVDLDDLCRVGTIFRRAVAALSPPHCMSENARTALDALPQLQGARPDFQFRVRKVVLFCLDHLDLADSKVQPALQFLKSLLSKYQELDAGGDQKIGCKKHWRLLEMKCGMSSKHAAADEDSGTPKKEKRILCRHDRRRDSCRICQPCPHGHIKRLCLICRPCPHGKSKRDCIMCSGCEHGKAKRQCPVCNACVHGRHKYTCPLCKQRKHQRCSGDTCAVSRHFVRKTWSILVNCWDLNIVII